MLINFNVYEQDKFRAQLRRAWKTFYNLEASLSSDIKIALKLQFRCEEIKTQQHCNESQLHVFTEYVNHYA